jgi:hypothetical protein
MADLRIGWLTFPVLIRLREIETTFAYGQFSRLSMRRVGVEWGEGEWTAQDLWRGGK